MCLPFVLHLTIVLSTYFYNLSELESAKIQENLQRQHHWMAIDAQVIWRLIDRMDEFRA